MTEYANCSITQFSKQFLMDYQQGAHTARGLAAVWWLISEMTPVSFTHTNREDMPI